LHSLITYPGRKEKTIVDLGQGIIFWNIGMVEQLIISLEQGAGEVRRW
jgi:hypothetical protein